MSVTLSLFGLDLPQDRIASLHASLDAGEQARAARFRAPQDAIRFIARRGQMRLLLAGTVGCAPDRIRIEQTPAGKPFVAGAPHFSLSHSGSVALFALSDDAEVGCDIERRDVRLADRDVAERFFAPAEKRALAALSDSRWVEGFFNCWTRKEAVVKALGFGLSYPLDSFAVSLVPGEAAALQTPTGAHRLHAFDVPPDHHVAVCVASDRPVAPPIWIDPCADLMRAAA